MRCPEQHEFIELIRLAENDTGAVIAADGVANAANMVPSFSSRDRLPLSSMFSHSIELEQSFSS